MFKRAHKVATAVFLNAYIMSLVLMAGPLMAQNLFFSRVTLQTAVSSKSVHLADFNGDQKLDIAVLNSDGPAPDSIAVRLSTASGYSAPVVTLTGGLGSWSMATGDFNHDGKLDVAVTNNVSDNISILLGNGDGTFRLGGYYQTDLSPTAITAADFNHDGHVDLAIVNGGSGDITILLGKGDGTFRSSPSIFLGSSPTDLVSNDFNGDGIPDLAVTNGALSSQVVVILLGNGDGSFRIAESAITGNEPFAITTGLFSHDGKSDLAVANLASNNVSILDGIGDGTFHAASTLTAGTGPAGIAVGDFNQDGKLDLAVCNDVSGEVSVYLGNGDGTFQSARSFATGGSPTSIAVGDLYHNGRKDIVTAGPNGIVLLINKAQ